MKFCDSVFERKFLIEHTFMWRTQRETLLDDPMNEIERSWSSEHYFFYGGKVALYLSFLQVGTAQKKNAGINLLDSVAVGSASG